METHLSVHGVSSIDVSYHEGSGAGRWLDVAGGWIDVVLTDSNGQKHVTTAFVAGPIEIKGAEFINMMAQREPEQDLTGLLRKSIEMAKEGKL